MKIPTYCQRQTSLLPHSCGACICRLCEVKQEMCRSCVRAKLVNQLGVICILVFRGGWTPLHVFV